ncbi:MAG: gamma carbonic anhydrase family protein [Planctomycetota bacterium]|nr:gamma carbonic anhydrase family protein [Planctomycetota bacterium]
MLIEHQGKGPTIHESAWVAPNAIVSGDVTIGPHARVLYGAVLTAESGSITIGAHSLVMEQAVVRATKRFPTRIGDHVLIGPHAHLSGCNVEDDVFIATGSSIFNGATLERAATVRINGIVHINSRLPQGVDMPIGWIAVGDPAQILSPDQWDAIGPALRNEDFSKTVFGLDASDSRSNVMKAMTTSYAEVLGRHRDDVILNAGG